MAELDGDASNTLLDILGEWNTYLENYIPYYQERDKEPESVDFQASEPWRLEP